MIQLDRRGNSDRVTSTSYITPFHPVYGPPILLSDPQLPPVEWDPFFGPPIRKGEVRNAPQHQQVAGSKSQREASVVLEPEDFRVPHGGASAFSTRNPTREPTVVTPSSDGLGELSPLNSKDRLLDDNVHEMEKYQLNEEESQHRLAPGEHTTIQQGGGAHDDTTRGRSTRRYNKQWPRRMNDEFY